MLVDPQLREIAGKSAGVYSLVIDNTRRSAVPVQTTLRLIPINVPQGPVNCLVYINKADYAGFERIFGPIKARDERKGNFSIRTVRHALENGPVVVINLRNFDDTKDLAGVLGASSKCTEVNENVYKVPFRSLYNTDRLWYPDHNKMQDITELENNLISFGNVGNKKLSFFVRKAEVSGWDMTVREYYASSKQEFPEYINPDDLVRDTFLDVYIFGTDLSDNLVNMSNENYGYLFTENGLKSVYKENGVEYDGLELLSQITDAKYVRKYTGSLIPGLTDSSNNSMDLIQLVNADTVNTGMLMHMNEDLADTNFSDWEPSYNDLDEIEYANDGNKRPFGIDFLGHGRFHTNQLGLVEVPSGDADYKQWLSHDPLVVKHAKSLCTAEVSHATKTQPGVKDCQKVFITGKGTEEKTTSFKLNVDGKNYTVAVVGDQDTNAIAQNIAKLNIPGYTMKIIPGVTTPSIGVGAPSKLPINQTVEYDVSVVPGNKSGKMVLVHGTITGFENVEKIEYFETSNSNWHDLQVSSNAFTFGYSGTGFQFTEATNKFRISLKSAGIVTCNLEVKDFSSQELYASTNFEIQGIESGDIEPNDNLVSSKTCVSFTAKTAEKKPNIVTEDIDSGIIFTQETIYAGKNEIPAMPEHTVINIDKSNDLNLTNLNETIEMTAFVKNNKLGITECYVIALQTGLFTGDYAISKSSNITRVKNGTSVGEVVDENGVTYNVIKVETTDLIACSTILDETFGTEKLILNDGTVIDGLKKTSVWKFFNIYEPSEYSPLKAISLDAYKPRFTSIKDGVGQFCDGTPQTQKEILNLLNDPHLVEGFKALIDYKFRYVVDAFTTYIEPQAKQALATFAGTLNVRAIANVPSMESFAKCKNPYFKDTPTSSFDPKYIMKGGNNKLVSSNQFSLPVDNADKIWFFGPWMKNNSTGREIIVPCAGAVSKAFLNKFLAGNMFPYSAVANDTGILQVDGMTGMEYDLTDTERDTLEPNGYNPIVYIQNQGYCIFGNQTAQQKIKSDLSKIHVSELVFTIQEEMKNILKGYVFKNNNYANRLAIWNKAEAVMKQILHNGGVYWYQNIIDESNNTQDVINEDMGILDTIIVAQKLGEKWVHRTYLEKSGNIIGFEVMQA